MTRKFVRLRRIAALSVSITLFAAPIASAQSPEADPSDAAPANTALLSPAAFARLAHQPPADVAPAPAVAETPRPSLLRQGTTAMARLAQAAPAKAPQRSWASRHKTALIVWSAIAGAIPLLLVWYVGTDCAHTGCG